MARPGNQMQPSDANMLRGLVLDSRDLFSEENYEDRVDLELALLMQEFKKNGTVDAARVREEVNKFIGVAEAALRKLEDAKRRAEREEINNINRIRSFLVEGGKINVKSLKKELEKFGEKLKSDTLSALRYNRRREKQLRRERAPFGFVLKKLRSSQYLDKEVARKAFRAGEHTLKEPQLFSEIDYLIRILSKNPNKEALEQLKERIYRLTKDYEGDLDTFLTIEVDLEIEEARRLHRIDHYIAFLNMIRRVGNFDDLINKLNALKAEVNKWVYQDSIDAKRLQQYASKSLEYGQNLLKTSQTDLGGEFPGIVMENYSALGEIPGILIFNKNKPLPNRGIVLVHGAFGTKETLLVLGKRLASQDFLVYTMDMPQHGENTSLFRLGIITEQILKAVSFLRSKGVRNVGVVGHSLGAICTLFAMTGYNFQIEQEFFEATSRVLERIDKIREDLKKGQERKKSEENLISLRYEYQRLKKSILRGMQQMYASNSKIDAAVLLSPPKTVQFFLPPQISFLMKHKLIGRLIGKSENKKFFNLVAGIGEAATLPEYMLNATKQKGRIQIVGGDVTNIYDCFNYVQSVKNPYDYMRAIEKLLSKPKSGDKDVQFIRYFVNLIRKTPKLFIYGLGDMQILKSYILAMISKKFPVGRLQLNELEDHYNSFGGEIVRIPNLNHTLTKEGNSKVFEVARMPKITYKIVTFLNQSLGRGRLV